MPPNPLARLVCLAVLLASVPLAHGQLFGRKATPAPRTVPATSQTMRKPNELIRKQEPLKVNQSLMRQATPDNVHVVVSIPKQRAFLMIGEQIVADSPISSGKRGHGTPTGNFSVLEKD